MDYIYNLIKAERAHYKRLEGIFGVTFNFLNQTDDEDKDKPDYLDSNGDKVIVRLNRPIGGFYGIKAADIIDRLDEANPSEIELLVDSPGGFVSQGLSLYTDFNARKESGTKITAKAMGTVASAATLPFLAADNRYIAKGSQLMIHNAWSGILIMGNAKVLRKESATMLQHLEATDDNLVDIYKDKLNIDGDKIEDYMDKEYLFNAKEASEKGFGELVEKKSEEPAPQLESEALSEADEIRLQRTLAEIQATLQ